MVNRPNIPREEGLVKRVKEFVSENKFVFTLAGALVVFFGGMCYYEYGPHSRRTLNPKGKVIEYVLPKDFNRMINVSSGGSEGDVLLTYETVDGEFKSKEYNRLGLWQTDLNWVRADSE